MHVVIIDKLGGIDKGCGKLVRELHDFVREGHV